MMDPVWSASSVIIQVLAFIVILPFDNNEKEPLTRLGVHTAQATGSVSIFCDTYRLKILHKEMGRKIDP